MVLKGSAKKGHRRSEKRRLRNKSVRTRVRNSAKVVLDAVKSENQGAAEAAFRTFSSLMDTAVSKGVYHRNSAARRKSRLAQKVNAIQ